MCTIDDGKAICCQPFALNVATVEIMYFKALAVGSQTVVQAEEVFRFITDGRQDLIVDFGGTL